MSRTVASLPAGSRITDYISLGVVAKTFPLEKIRASLAATGKESVRQRELPAHVVVYYVIALALYMQSSYREVLRCLLEGIQWLVEPAAGINVAGNSGISQARTRLGWEPVRQLHDEVVRPVAVVATKGAWYRAWRLISVDPKKSGCRCRLCRHGSERRGSIAGASGKARTTASRIRRHRSPDFNCSVIDRI